MKVVINGWQVTWIPTPNGPREDCSIPHQAARLLLAELFPMDMRLEEVALPSSPTQPQTLWADFYLPGRRLMVEVQGSQHSEFTPFFHKTILDFWASKKRDNFKKNFCDDNCIFFVELDSNESIECWREKLVSFTKSE